MKKIHNRVSTVLHITSILGIQDSSVWGSYTIQLTPDCFEALQGEENYLGKLIFTLRQNNTFSTSTIMYRHLIIRLFYSLSNISELLQILPMS